MAKMKCANCNEEILAAKINICPYCRSRNLISIVKKEVNIPKKIEKIAKLEKIGRYCEAAKEYELLGMQRKAKHCKRHAIAEASKLENARKYAKAATVYADLEMWEKAYTCLKSEKTHLKK